MPTMLLERTEYDEKPVYAPSVSEREHNARIKNNYAALMDQSKNLDEILNRGRYAIAKDAFAQSAISPVQEPVEFSAMPASVKSIPAYEPELITGARADADIFRADSEVNRHLFATPFKAAADATSESSEEAENEDLVPTRTTTQYRTIGVKSAAEAGKLENVATKQGLNLSKRDKIIIAVSISVVLGFLALVIINAIVLAAINGNVLNLQSSLTTVKGAYEGIKDEISPYLNITEEDLKDFAALKGWVKIG